MCDAEPKARQGVEHSDYVASWGAHDRLLPGALEDDALRGRSPALRRRSAAALLALSLVAACGVLRLSAQGKHWRPRLETHLGSQAYLVDKGQPICGLMEEDVDYWTKPSLSQKGNITSAETCLDMCEDDRRCRAWTWGKPDNGAPTAGVCFLKGLGPRKVLERHADHGVVSGLKCESDADDTEKTTTTRTTSASSTTTETPGRTTPAASTTAETSRRSRSATKSGWDSQELATKCGVALDSVDFWTKLPLYQKADIPDPEGCCAACQAEQTCWAWTWGKNGSVPGLANVCFLKGLRKPGEKPDKHENGHVVSGRVCRTMDRKPLSCDLAVGAPHHCHEIQDDIDYSTYQELFQLGSVQSAEDCRKKCADSLGCGAWTWGKRSAARGIARVCFLKGLQIGEEPRKRRNPDVKSGLACEFRPFASKRTTTSSTTTSTTPKTTTVSSTTVTARSTTSRSSTTRSSSTATRASSGSTTRTTSTRETTTRERYQPGSLYCFALMLPTGYERGLITDQYNDHVSIFDCDEYMVYSSKVIELAPGLKTEVVKSDLKCNKGGEFMTALNTEIFFAVWDRVFSDGRFNLHAWTIKVDPDCVFLPSRLRLVLNHHHEGPHGVYINNCHMGMHGPLEVFSRIAVHRWIEGRQQCVDHFDKLCSGPCLWGEDMFIDQCLGKVLKVARENDWNILVEDHCAPPPHWDDCLDESKAAFHPFKDRGAWRKCMKNAGGY
uniref:Apple domain-containing protein n=1 Tax=Pyrodinium bahamense TaxID=73915 RepID=A0A7S0B7I7_9DINO